MTTVAASHHTVVTQRSYAALAAQVFSAWSDPAALARWYLPGDASWSSKILEHDFRVGGRKHVAFGPRVGDQFTEDCRYEDIVPDRRLCFSMTIAREKERISTSMVTVELVPRASATQVIVTDQLVVLDGSESAGDRQRGWGETLDKLTAELASR